MSEYDVEAGQAENAASILLSLDEEIFCLICEKEYMPWQSYLPWIADVCCSYDCYKEWRKANERLFS